MKISSIIKNSIIANISAIIVPLAAIAAPSITSLSSTSLSHKQTITVNGSGFGVKSPVAPLMWDSVGAQPAYAGLTNGSTIPVGGSNPWPSYGEPTGAPVYKSNHPRGVDTAHYSNSAGSSSPVSGTGKANVGGLNFPSIGSGKMYVSWWMYSGAALNPSGNTSNKFLRATVDATWANATVMWTPLLATSIYDFSGVYRANKYLNWSGTVGAWNRNEIVIDNSTPVKPRVMTYVNNALLLNILSGEGSCGSACTAGTLNSNINGIYTLGFDASNSTGLQPMVEFGDIYIDNTLAKVEVCNSSTKSGSNHCEIQIPQTTWNDGQLQIQVNQGSFPDNSTAYLFVVDANGNASPGKAITFGAGSGGGLFAPANLKVAAQ